MGLLKHWKRLRRVFFKCIFCWKCIRGVLHLHPKKIPGSFFLLTHFLLMIFSNPKIYLRKIVSCTQVWHDSSLITGLIENLSLERSEAILLLLTIRGLCLILEFSTALVKDTISCEPRPNGRLALWFRALVPKHSCLLTCGFCNKLRYFVSHELCQLSETKMFTVPGSDIGVNGCQHIGLSMWRHERVVKECG